jgi:outer membrane protein OmpA-like peptidoglycan-associated protein
MTMLKSCLKPSLIAAALVAVGAVQAADYVTAGGAPLRTASGECVRTGYWSEASAECERVRVFFAFDRAVLDENARQVLGILAEKLRDGRVERVVAVGYADAIGADRYNERLSEMRAKAVRDFLLEKGAPLEALALHAKGRRHPQTLGDCERLIGKESAQRIACLAPDRRVEIDVIGQPRM